MKSENVTREMIRAIKPGRTAVFSLPSREACASARVQVTHVKNMNGRTYTCHVDNEDMTVAVTCIEEAAEVEI